MNEQNKFGLTKNTIQLIQSVFSKYSQIEKVILYGSRAKGNFKAGSDIDLTIVAPKLTTTELLKIENDLDNLMLPYKIDLSLLHQIENPDLVEHIKRIGVEFK